ncbi:MAG: hypothetical protein K2N73_08570 [Lachnospiraceae bacterium]|nr:hypothetical protein [Lachnospiraceae bacterium]
MAEKKKVQETAKFYSKEQLILSGHFQDRRDIVSALLDSGKQYTVKDVDEKIRNYMKGKVSEQWH